MATDVLNHAVEFLEKANANLDPELLTAASARKRFATYARAEKRAAYGAAALARKIDDAEQIARSTGTSAGRARAVVETGKVMAQSDDLSFALQQGKVSIDQAAEIAGAEKSAPGAAK